MSSVQTALKGLVADLHERGRLRVWSLVVTFFGDAVAPRGGRVALAVLQDVMGRLGVEAGALRTALSRLAADQWVMRERAGRNSLYALDGHGRHAFDQATRLIYAPGPPDWDGTLTAVVAPPGIEAREAGRALEALGFAPTGPASWLRPETAQSADAGGALAGLLVLSERPAVVPPGLADLWDLAPTAAAYAAFRDAMAPLLASLEASEPACLLDAAAARTLLVHDWRRIVLHDPGLPAELLPPAWPGDAARDVARRIYGHLSRPSEAWLDRAGLPPLVNSAAFARRFGLADA